MASAAHVALFRSLLRSAQASFRRSTGARRLLDLDRLLAAAPTLFISTKIVGDQGVMHTYCDVQEIKATHGEGAAKGRHQVRLTLRKPARTCGISLSRIGHSKPVVPDPQNGQKTYAIRRGVLHEVTKSELDQKPRKVTLSSEIKPIDSAHRRITAAVASVVKRARAVASGVQGLPLDEVKRYEVTHIDPDAGVMLFSYDVKAARAPGRQNHLTVLGEGDMLVMGAKNVDLFTTKVLIDSEPVEGTTYLLRGKTLHKFTVGP
jgi:hypothetical protein